MVEDGWEWECGRREAWVVLVGGSTSWTDIRRSCGGGGRRVPGWIHSLKEEEEEGWVTGDGGLGKQSSSGCLAGFTS